jgi:ATP-dependent DNA ligase
LPRSSRSERPDRAISLLLGAYKEGKLQYVGKIGTGLGARVLDEIAPQLKASVTNASPFAGKPTRSAAVRALVAGEQRLGEIGRRTRLG